MKPEEMAELVKTDPSAKMLPVEMTPELKAHLQEVCCDVVDLLQKRTRGPIEAVMVMHFVEAALEALFEARGLSLKGFAIIEEGGLEH